WWRGRGRGERCNKIDRPCRNTCAYMDTKVMGPRSFLLVAACARDLLLQHLPDIELELPKLRRCRQRHEVARAGKRHVDNAFDAARLGGHDHGAVAEQQCLLDRMGDVDHGLAGLLPDTQEFSLQ